MKKTLFAIAAVLFGMALTVSCGKMDEPIPNQYLVSKMGGYINLDQKNKFSVGSIIGAWEIDSIYEETYVNGNRTERRQQNNDLHPSTYRFNRGYTMGGDGKWTYAHNFLVWEDSGGLHAYEVVRAGLGTLVLRWESFPQGGGSHVPYVIDKGGEHRFVVYKFHRK